MKTKLQTINLGNRVELANPEASVRLPNMNNGIVVKHHGEHDPKNPRVRWASGWGVTSKAKDLRLMTAEEITKLPMPMILDIDK
jgi:hypothetical protein